MIEEAIKQLQERFDIEDYKEDLPEYYKALELGINALKKQIGVKPIKHTAEVLYGMFTCPRCAFEIDIHHGHPMYCSSCGQKIDWSEEGVYQ